MKKDINGILLLDKPLNMTSNEALQRVKRLFQAKKAGHTGSLDPLATGMLPICFGEGTKFSQYLLESDKSYLVEAILGIKTTTGDAEGEIIDQRPFDHVTQSKIERALNQLTGTIEQIPPMYSAIKYQGKPLYELARAGIEIERNARKVQIHHFKLLNFEHNKLQLSVHCSKGTYVRTLIEDMGELLESGAYVSGLRREIVYPYQHEKMYSYSLLEEISNKWGHEALVGCLLPIETSVRELPALSLSVSAMYYLRMGQSVMVPHAPTSGLVRIFSIEDRFIGLGEVQEDGKIAPKRLLAGGLQRLGEGRV